MKRVLSVVLCMVMVLSLVPMAAFADTIANPFKDVKESDYFYDAVLWAVAEGVTTGTSSTTFSPNASCTRAQVVTFLHRAAGSPEPASSENPFKDVKESEYYYKAVLWAVEEGVTTGTSSTTFSPNASCTRAQVVTFLHRASGSPEPASSTNPFKDVAQGEYYSDAVLWAVEKGITTGTGDTTFSPNATCTRGQIVTFLYRYMASAESLAIVFHPADYHMGSSMETADFAVQVKGGTAPYTFQWVICYDNEEVMAEPVTADSPIHVFSQSFSDYDFDEYRDIGVYCVITDAAGNSVESDLAEVIPYSAIRIVSQPADYQMTSSQEDAEFTITVEGGVAPYTYEWVVCYDNEEVWYESELELIKSNTFSVEISDYDFDAYNDIGVYCIVTDGAGNSVESDLAEVLPYNPMPLTLLASPDSYQMEFSQEEIEFTVEIMGGTPAYTYEWFVVRDGVEECVETYITDDVWHTLTYTFTDYDFDYCSTIEVYCVVTDEEGDFVVSDVAEVLPQY